MLSFFPYTKQLRKILMNQRELAATLIAIAAQNEKAHAEIKAATAANLQAVQDLTDKLAGAPISDELAAALALVQETAQAIDDLNPDVTVAVDVDQDPDVTVAVDVDQDVAL